MGIPLTRPSTPTPCLHEGFSRNPTSSLGPSLVLSGRGRPRGSIPTLGREYRDKALPNRSSIIIVVTVIVGAGTQDSKEKKIRENRNTREN